MEEREKPGRLLTCKEVAELLRVSVAVVYTLCATRQIRHERIGTGRGRLFIPRDAVEEYRRRRTVEPAEEGGREEAPSPPRRRAVKLTSLRLRSDGSPRREGGPGSA